MKSVPGTQQGSNQELRERCHEQTHQSFPARNGTDTVLDPMMQVVEIGARHRPSRCWCRCTPKALWLRCAMLKKESCWSNEDGTCLQRHRTSSKRRRSSTAVQYVGKEGLQNCGGRRAQCQKNKDAIASRRLLDIAKMKLSWRRS